MTIKTRTKAVDVDGAVSREVSTKAVDFESGNAQAMVVVQAVYNPSTLKFEWGTKPSIEINDLNVSMGDVEALLAEYYWKRTKYDWTSGKLDYVGGNIAANAAEGASDWQVFKYQWDGDNVVDIQVRIGSWTNRASLGWAV